MGKKIGWFDMESPRERKKREDRYFSNMFPLGPQQKERELALLKELVSSARPEDALYQLLVVKELLLDNEKEEMEPAIVAWRATPLARRFSRKEQDRIIALAKRMTACASLEDMPSAGEIE